MRHTTKQAEHVQQIRQIRVDPDTIVEHFTKNRHGSRLCSKRSFKVTGIRSGAPCEIQVGVDPRRDGAYYPDSPHPVWIPPLRFVRGWSHDEDRRESEADAIGFPRETENKRVLREEGYQEDTDAFRAAHESAMSHWKEMWDAAVRNDLKSELTFRFFDRVREIETVEHTVPVRYVSED